MAEPRGDPRAGAPPPERQISGAGIFGCLRFASIFFGLICLVGTGLAGWFYFRTHTWIKVDATVTRSWQSTVTGSHAEHELAGYVELRYDVHGHAVKGKLRRPFEPKNQAGLKAYLQKYAPGSVHTVYYNPVKPQEIVLVKAGADEPYKVGLVALGTQVFTVLGVLMLIIGRRIKPKPLPPDPPAATTA